MREWIAWEADYLARVRTHARARLAAGVDAEAIPGQADFGTFVGDRLSVESHGMPRRHEMVVRKITAEEMGVADVR